MKLCAISPIDYKRRKKRERRKIWKEGKVPAIAADWVTKGKF